MSSERAQNHLHSPRIGISVPESEHKPDHFQMVASRTQVHKLANAEGDISKKSDNQVATPTREMKLKRYWAQMSAKGYPFRLLPRWQDPRKPVMEVSGLYVKLNIFPQAPEKQSHFSQVTLASIFIYQRVFGLLLIENFTFSNPAKANQQDIVEILIPPFCHVIKLSSNNHK
jgi:hypothetical protein